jgi:hypothetical protein
MCRLFIQAALELCEVLQRRKVCDLSFQLFGLLLPVSDQSLTLLTLLPKMLKIFPSLGEFHGRSSNRCHSPELVCGRLPSAKVGTVGEGYLKAPAGRRVHDAPAVLTLHLGYHSRGHTNILTTLRRRRRQPH